MRNAFEILISKHEVTKFSYSWMWTESVWRKIRMIDQSLRRL